MTKLEAVKHLLRGQIDAKIIDYDYDPAGSETNFQPSSDDCAALAALIPGFDPDKDLGFSVGGLHNAHFYVLAEARDRIVI